MSLFIIWLNRSAIWIMLALTFSCFFFMLSAYRGPSVGIYKGSVIDAHKRAFRLYKHIVFRTQLSRKNISQLDPTDEWI